MPHSLDEMILEAAKLHAQQLENIVKTLGVCQWCRVAPIQVIAQPPTFEVELLNDPVLTAVVGYPAVNPFINYNTRVRITEVVCFLCLDCAPDSYQRRSDATDPSRQG